MRSAQEGAAIVALLREGRRSPAEYAELVEAAGSALPVLRDELAGSAGGQGTLLPEDPGPLVEDARRDILRWLDQGWQLVTILDPGYPENLRTVHDRPPLIFMAGELAGFDARSVAIIGSRRASEEGLALASEIARHAVSQDWVVISGLAAGVDTAAHRSALGGGGRTIAVLGTGLAHAYPPQNVALQREIAARGAVISQFWPQTPPDPTTFPQRNAVMSGLARGTVVVEASERSGARVQARLALAHGRPVFLTRLAAAREWARALAARPGVTVIDEPREITDVLERLDGTDALEE